MNRTPHPTAEQLDRYRRRTAPPAETLELDAHVAECERCFEAVRADRHLTFEELAAVADGGTGSAHLALCARCRGEVEDLRQMRAVLRNRPAPNPWRWMAAAAVLVVVTTAAAFFFRKPPPSPAAPAPVEDRRARLSGQAGLPVLHLARPGILDTLVTERAVLRGTGAGGAFALHAPVATVVLEERPRFRWDEVAGATAYEIAVVELERGTVVAEGTSRTSSWQPDAPLPRGRSYAWQVAAETGGGRIVAPGKGGAEARFHVATQFSVEGGTPRERGVALANLGALDDAERELAAAGAEELLRQVRAWRE